MNEAVVLTELKAVGFDERTLVDWTNAAPKRTGDFFVDRPHYMRFWLLCSDLIGRLPHP